MSECRLDRSVFKDTLGELTKGCRITVKGIILFYVISIGTVTIHVVQKVQFQVAYLKYDRIICIFTRPSEY